MYIYMHMHIYIYIYKAPKKRRPKTWRRRALTRGTSLLPTAAASSWFNPNCRCARNWDTTALPPSNSNLGNKRKKKRGKISGTDIQWPACPLATQSLAKKQMSKASAL
jgi:hypothetical protein